jgi:hypothetical protein
MPAPEQLNIIHLRMERLRIELDDGEAELALGLQRPSQALKEEAWRRGETVHTVRGLVKDLAVGGLRLGVIGVVLLVFGLALATWAPEIADLLPER